MIAGFEVFAVGIDADDLRHRHAAGERSLYLALTPEVGRGSQALPEGRAEHQRASSPTVGLFQIEDEVLLRCAPGERCEAADGETSRKVRREERIQTPSDVIERGRGMLLAHGGELLLPAVECSLDFRLDVAAGGHLVSPCKRRSNLAPRILRHRNRALNLIRLTEGRNARRRVGSDWLGRSITRRREPT